MSAGRQEQGCDCVVLFLLCSSLVLWTSSRLVLWLRWRSWTDVQRVRVRRTERQHSSSRIVAASNQQRETPLSSNVL